MPYSQLINTPGTEGQVLLSDGKGGFIVGVSPVVIDPTTGDVLVTGDVTLQTTEDTDKPFLNLWNDGAGGKRFNIGSTNNDSCEGAGLLSIYNATDGGWPMLLDGAGNVVFPGSASFASGHVTVDTDWNLVVGHNITAQNDLFVSGIAEFSSNVSVDNGHYLLFNGSSDTNWRTGIIDAFTTSTIGEATSLQTVIGTGSDGPDGWAVGQTGGESILELRGYDAAAYFSGNVTATAFYGDGSNLSGLTSPTFEDVLATGNTSGANNVTFQQLVNFGGSSGNSYMDASGNLKFRQAGTISSGSYGGSIVFSGDFQPINISAPAGVFIGGLISDSITANYGDPLVINTHSQPIIIGDTSTLLTGPAIDMALPTTFRAEAAITGGRGIQIKGSSDFPTAGAGLEIVSNGSTSWIQSINRANDNYFPMFLGASTITTNSAARTILGGATDDTSTPVQIGANGGVSLMASGSGSFKSDQQNGAISASHSNGTTCHIGWAGIACDFTAQVISGSGPVEIGTNGAVKWAMDSGGGVAQGLTAPTSVGYAINLASAQSAPVLQITSFGGTAGDRFQIAANGDEIVYGVVYATNNQYTTLPLSEPADGTMALNELVAWVDQTGNFLNFKVMFNDGVTVKRASLALI